MNETKKDVDTLAWLNASGVPDGGILGIVLSVVAAILWLRRRVSADTKVIRADGQETKFVDNLLKELEDARAALQKASEEKSSMQLEIGGLRERVRHLDEANTRMSLEFDEMKDRLRHFERAFTTLKLDAFKTGQAPAPHDAPGSAD